ncbi:SRPBCC domain-containing protein [Nereida sp. MMG025]|uniref:ArsR/SmtB family transcription factor n=1 Tax=Nereida sp. MMG025 TaxID=2909981 RepID=UPI001F408154|nr:SRPBCC domain-containing protein [Nereida sp. MMG025]MCF6443865.1 helix-turn-helix domain-containing protein [Nereida sp. MMG025]
MDKIFKALSDPARRTLLDALRRKDGQSLTELEKTLDGMTRFGVMKHLQLLEKAQLITTRKDGRFKYHYLNALPIMEAMDRWVEPMRVHPTARAVMTLKTQLERPAQMKPDFVMHTYIRCTQDALWDALTSTDQMPNYHFMANDIRRDGARIDYYTPDGNLMLETVETKLDPKSRIESTFAPKWEGPTMTQSRFVYLIEADGENCKLTLEHYDIPAGQDGVADGWVRMLSNLKTFLETGRTAATGAA